MTIRRMRHSRFVRLTQIAHQATVSMNRLSMHTLTAPLSRLRPGRLAPHDSRPIHPTVHCRNQLRPIRVHRQIRIGIAWA